MKMTCTIVAMAALALPAMAMAQGEAWQFELVDGIGTEANPLRPGQETATVRLSLGAPAADWGLGGVRWFTHAEEAGWSNPSALISHPGQSPGEVMGATVGLSSAGQLDYCGGFIAEPGRLDVWEATFTITDFAAREIGLRTETTRYEVFRLDPCVGGPGTDPREVVEGLAAIFVVPALPCYGDCDRSGSLDFFDFLCFQTAFAAGDPYADCDGSGVIDLFDFLCFQEQFAAGCP